MMATLPWPGFDNRSEMRKTLQERYRDGRIIGIVRFLCLKALVRSCG